MEIRPEKIYMATGNTDLRKGIDGYAMIIQNEFHMDPMDQSLYIFCNRERNKVKCLYWDGSGFWLLYKRLEKGHFKWKRSGVNQTYQISEQQLRWLLEGLKVEQKTSIEKIERKYI
jgi:transposase